MVLKVGSYHLFFSETHRCKIPDFFIQTLHKRRYLKSLFKRIKIFLENFLLSHQLEQSKFRNNQSSQ
ncbi:hypothetical protein [Leptospira interrogans]|uniref:hypothetical protein n=1 Tax=Leptospira interrogans TaxID=173 RepID=UPI0002BA8D05|nr:hypothetical protein [Leptospira interrogans]MCR8649160.1 hypothetical protein [Leptospira interrogans serovar Bataviae]OAM86019.1 hypothetical protein A1343_02235 [Leptospira interrogans serovar Bataviae]QOI39998.1 hypothetical protein Lepto1548_18195 [Leptospira interrogans serovar Bataviae]QYY60245.1 hypothetical protein GR153_016825 [Leptospira interrogans serovar Bataviae]